MASGEPVSDAALLPAMLLLADRERGSTTGVLDLIGFWFDGDWVLADGDQDSTTWTSESFHILLFPSRFSFSALHSPSLLWDDECGHHCASLQGIAATPLPLLRRGDQMFV